MLEGAADIRTLDRLREFIHTALCAKENLLEEQALMRELPLLRGGRTCGVQFTVRGPRSVRLGAIWAQDQNVVYLYDAKGERYAKVSLRHALDAESLDVRSCEPATIGA